MMTQVFIKTEHYLLLQEFMQVHFLVLVLAFVSQILK